MSQPIWHPPNIERYTCKQTRHDQAWSPKQKVLIWLTAGVLSWLMALGTVKLSLMVYAVLRSR